MSCGILGCQKRALRDAQGYCLLCERRLCHTHALRPAHQCPDVFIEEEWETFQLLDGAARKREIVALIEKVDFGALVDVIALLRPGQEATIDPMFLGSQAHIDYSQLLMGGCNLHVPITFADGVSWLVRIPRDNIQRPSPALSRALIASEVSTLRYLRTAGLPVPEVFAAETTGDNRVRTPYIILERMQGKPMMFESPSLDQKHRQIAQTAAHFVQLAACQLSALGYVQDAAGNVGPLLDPNIVETSADGNIIPFGPFETSRAFHRGHIGGILRDIVNGIRYVSRPLDAYLVHLQLLDVVDRLYPEKDPGRAPFFIKHPDDKGDNHLVDDECNIVSIIDWEKTRSCSPQDAFVGPTFMIDVATFYEGDNSLSADEAALAAALETLNRPDLAAYVLNGKRYQRLEFCIGQNLHETDYWPLFRGLLTASGFDDWPSWESWKAHVLRTEVYGSILEVKQMQLLAAGQ